MGGGGHEEDPESGGKAAGYSALPPSEPPHLQGQDPRQYQYGTFPHAASGEFRPYPPVGFPQPPPLPGFGSGYQNHHQHHQQQPYAPPEAYYAQGYQAVPDYGRVVEGIPVVEGRPMRMGRLPNCGIGLGWFLFIAGFFLAAVPWYVGAFILICVRVHDNREKPGYVACTIAAVIAAIVIPLGVTKGTDVH